MLHSCRSEKGSVTVHVTLTVPVTVTVPVQQYAATVHVQVTEKRGKQSLS